MKLNLSIEQLFKILFTESTFIKKLWVNRKIKNVKFSEWTLNNEELNTRKMTYIIDIGALGKAHNVDHQVRKSKKNFNY